MPPRGGGRGGASAREKRVAAEPLETPASKRARTGAGSTQPLEESVVQESTADSVEPVAASDTSLVATSPGLSASQSLPAGDGDDEPDEVQSTQDRALTDWELYGVLGKAAFSYSSLDLG